MPLALPAAIVLYRCLDLASSLGEVGGGIIANTSKPWNCLVGVACRAIRTDEPPSATPNSRISPLILCRSISRRALVRRFSFTGVRWVRRSRSTARTSEGRSAHRPLRIKRRKVESICHLCEKVRYSTEAQMVTSNSTLARRKRHAIRAFGVGRHSLADGTRWCHRYDI